MKKNSLKEVYPLKDFDWDSLADGKYNYKVKLNDSDLKNGTKILCKEPYAQALYDKYREYESKIGIDLHAFKDLQVDQLYTVNANTICFKTNTIKTTEVNSGVEIIVPFKDYAGDLEDLKQGNGLTFKVILYKANVNCEYVASEKKSRYINYKDELLDSFENNKWFEVTIKKLIKGGYIATYKNEIDCFIPGSQAGANVIKDFSILLGKTINVMVDNYDSSSNLFIVSYKKYIKYSLPTKVSDLRFGKLYSGKLTNKPYDFGVFVELENYYTGLVHSSDFENYDDIKKKLKAGDDIDVYVKGVSFNKKKDQHRIILSLNKESIPEELIQWDQIKEDLEGKQFDFSIIEDRKNTIEIYYSGQSLTITLGKEYNNIDLSTLSKISIHKVDSLNKNFSYSLIS